MEDKEDIDGAIDLIDSYRSHSLTQKLSYIESEIRGEGRLEIKDICKGLSIGSDLLGAARTVKKLSAEIDVIIHSVGILCSLENVLHAEEKVEYVSLGAGNTGKKFDLETDQRIAEYKFIDWRGGAETIRQNGIFKDFYELAEYNSHKKKYLYLNSIETPLKFFNGGRALTSVLSRRPVILENIRKKYGSSIERVRDYYQIHKDNVELADIRQYLES